MRYGDQDTSNTSVIGDPMDGDAVTMSAAPADDDLDDEDEYGETDDEDEADDTDTDDEDEDDSDDGDDDLDDEDEDDDSDDDDGDGSDAIDAGTLEGIARSGSRNVPISRLNQVLEQNRQLTAALQSVQNAQAGNRPPAPEKPTEPEFDIKAKRKERNEAIVDGDMEKAAAIDEEIDQWQEARAARAAASASQQALERDRVVRAINAVTKKYPILNENQDVLDEVAALRDILMRRGASMAEAIQEASKRVCGRYAKPDDVLDGQRKPGKKAAGKVDKAAAEANLRRAGRASRQPPRTSGAGMSGRAASPDDIPDLERMSEAQYEAWRRKNPKAHARLKGAV